MTSFAKVCMDLSNNLKNLRFTRSGSPVPPDRNSSLTKSIQDSISPKMKTRSPASNGNVVTSSEPKTTASGTHKSPKFNKKPAPPVPQKKENYPDQVISCKKTENIDIVSTTLVSSLPEQKTTQGRSGAHPTSRPPVSPKPKLKHGSSGSDIATQKSSSALQNGGMLLSRKVESTEAIEDQVIGSAPRIRTKYSCSPTMGHRSAKIHSSQGFSCSPEDLLNSFKGRSCYASACSSPLFPHHGMTIAAIKQRLLNQGLQLECPVPIRKVFSTRHRNLFRRLTRDHPSTTDELWKNEKILTAIFSSLDGRDMLTLCSVCKLWLRLLCKFDFWSRVAMQLDIRLMLGQAMDESMQEGTLITRGSHTDCLPKSMEAILERQLAERIRLAVRRHIRVLTISHLSDRYALIFLRALTNIVQKSSYNKVVKLANASSFQRPLRLESLCNHPPRTDESTSSEIVDDVSSESVTRVPLSDISSKSCVNSAAMQDQFNHSQDTLFFSPLMTSNLSGVHPQDCLPQTPAEHPRPCSETEAQNAKEKEKSIIYSFSQLTLRGCSIVDCNLAQLVQLLPGLSILELQCCNELTEMAFWTCLVPSITELRVFDCINVSDESMKAIAHMLPQLKRLTLQVYHVTDTAFSYFSAQQRTNLETVQLIQCMDLTNQAVINLACALPKLRQLSLSGCSNLTDDGLDVVCGNLKQLVELDLSWCAKMTDTMLECIACDLIWLQKVVLDRCMTITDVGLGYLSALPKLQHLSLRWCMNLSDGIIPHLLGMTQLTYLSLAGCKRITEDGLSQLARHPRLQRLELTHCTGASRRVKAYLLDKLLGCRILD